MLGSGRYLVDLGLHGRRDGGGRDELEGGRRVVGVLGGELHHQVDPVAAEVSRHHAAAVHSVHLRRTGHFLFESAASRCRLLRY